MAAVITAATILTGGVPAHGAPDSRCATSAVRHMLRTGSPSMMETVVIRDFTVDMKVDKKVWKVGETVLIHSTVTRPAHEDPAGQGIQLDPPASEPAGNVNMGIGLRVGDVFLFGSGITDADGKVDVKVKLKPYTKPGAAAVDGYAWNRVASTPCLNVEENGYTHVDNMFTVVK
ncbi:MAG TPA: hypothetical protein VFK89_09035 [Actinomycetota bacterium]|nr:hypothetical protein [Actinomycetota bacterium]